MYDYLIRNALIIDGTGSPRQPGDIALEGGRIAAMGVISSEASRVIDANGLVACPGFIDMHSHTDLRIMKVPTPEEKIRQGVTTELFGQDGMGVAPVDEAMLANLPILVAGLLGDLDNGAWPWRSFKDYLDALERHNLPNNVAVLVSHGPVRMQVMGMDKRRANALELKQMQAVLTKAFTQGAFGLSTGLIYPPCTFGDEDELIALNEVVAHHHAPFVVHQRDEGYLIRKAFSELVRVAQKTRAHLHISHLSAYGQVNWPLMDDVLAMADKHLASGNKLTWDRYPYLAGCTVLSAVLPHWAFADGTARLVENLKEYGFRQRIHEEFLKGLEVWNNRSISVGWEKIFVTAVNLQKNRWMEGKHCAELAEITRQHPVDFVCDLLAEENLAVTMISFYGSEQVLEKIVTHPMGTVGSDGIYGGRPHPRLFGCYPKYLSHFVKERNLLELPEAIRKVTEAPAKILGLSERGRLVENYWADLVLFNLDALADKATYENPSVHPEGIEYVWVNGDLVIERGIFTGKNSGKVLRKS